jgi:hypothetical protein
MFIHEMERPDPGKVELSAIIHRNSPFILNI